MAQHIPPTQNEMNRFVATVDEFMRNYKKLTAPKFRAQVYATGNQVIIADYQSAVNQARMLKKTIEATTGAWTAAKRTYASVTDQTSMVIGDAIDAIRGWFGGGPNADLKGLGAIQLPAAVWIAGIVSAAYLLNRTMARIFVSIEASALQRANPGMTRETALTVATSALDTGGFFGKATVPLLIAAGLAAYLIFNR